MSAIDRLDRTLLSVIGLLLLIGGGIGLAVGAGAFGDDSANEPVLSSSVDSFVSRNDTWFWPVMAAVALLLAYLGYRWLRGQLGVTPTRGDMQLDDDPEGSTRVRAGAATDALAADIERKQGVRSASARLLDSGAQGELALRVDLHDDASVGSVRDHIERYALPRFDDALEAEGLPAHVRFTLKDPEGRVVR